MRIRVYHDYYGCETGCCGHTIEFSKDGEEDLRFEFDHPESREEALEMAQHFIMTRHPECYDSIDWDAMEFDEEAKCPEGSLRMATHDQAVLVALVGGLPSAVLRAPTGQERYERLVEYVSNAQRELEHLLDGLPVEVEPLVALASWTIRGSAESLQQVRGALAGTPFEVAQDDTFFAHGDRAKAS